MEALLIDAQSAATVRRAFAEGRFGEVEESCKGVLAQAPETAWPSITKTGTNSAMWRTGRDSISATVPGSRSGFAEA